MIKDTLNETVRSSEIQTTNNQESELQKEKDTTEKPVCKSFSFDGRPDSPESSKDIYGTKDYYEYYTRL